MNEYIPGDSYVQGHICENFKCIPLNLNKTLAILGFHLLSDRTYNAVHVCITQTLTDNTKQSDKHVIYTTKNPQQECKQNEVTNHKTSINAPTLLLSLPFGEK
jgi:hypothetical protein